MTTVTVSELETFQRGDIGFVTGTWDAAGNKDVVDIDTGGSLVLTVAVTNVQKVAASPTIKYNDDGVGANNGHIALTPANTGDMGEWWAIVKT